MSKPDGRAMSSAEQMAMLEFLNGGPEIGRVRVDELYRAVAPRMPGKGRMIVASTGDWEREAKYSWLSAKFMSWKESGSVRTSFIPAWKPRIRFTHMGGVVFYKMPGSDTWINSEKEGEFTVHQVPLPGFNVPHPIDWNFKGLLSVGKFPEFKTGLRYAADYKAPELFDVVDRDGSVIMWPWRGKSRTREEAEKIVISLNGENLENGPYKIIPAK